MATLFGAFFERLNSPRAIVFAGGFVAAIGIGGASFANSLALLIASVSVLANCLALHSISEWLIQLLCTAHSIGECLIRLLGNWYCQLLGAAHSIAENLTCL